MKDSTAQHYRDTLGAMPETIQQMFAMSDELGENYTALRRFFFESRSEGLTIAMKEVLITVLDVAVGYSTGAVLHARAAKKAGLTRTQLTEALIATHLILGVSAWDKTGAQIWQEWEGTSS